MRNSLLFVMGLALFAPSAQSMVDVSAVQKEIKAQGLNWTAKSNWVSELPQENLVKMLGSQEVAKGLDYSDVYSRGMTYETVDWRNMNGINWLGPVMNQGNCGSCVAFSTIATLEAQISISSGTPWLAPRLSPQALFACGGGACERGWMIGPAASYATKKGIIDSACAPYTMGSTGKDVACQQFCQNQTDRTYKVSGSRNVTGMFNSSAQKVKDALKKGPLVTTMNVYEDFLVYSGGIYQTTGRRPVGGHAVSIVGYSDEGRYWIVRNSWGEDWGENGFVRISWDDRSGIGGSTIQFDIASEPNLVTFTSPQENEFVSGELKVETLAKTAGEFSIELMKDGRSVQTLDARSSGTKAQASLNTLGLEDGRYELVAHSVTNPEIKSFVRGFSVLNHEPSMSISFERKDGQSMSTMSDRVEFKVKTSAAPIQMQKIEFMVTTLDGKLVTKRTTDVVLKDMVLGFRFNTIPNGDYLIFFRGYMPAGGKIYTADSQKVHITNQN